MKKLLKVLTQNTWVVTQSPDRHRSSLAFVFVFKYISCLSSKELLSFVLRGSDFVLTGSEVSETDQE